MGRVTVLLVLPALALAQGRFIAAGVLSDGRTAHTATLLRDGRVLVVGGRGVDSLSVLSTAELFDPKSRSWSKAAPLLQGRAAHTATLLDDGRVLVAGGIAFDAAGSRFTAIADAEVYDPKANRWSKVGPLAQARSGHAALKLKDGRVLVTGGSREGAGILGSVELYDAAAAKWSPRRALVTPRTSHEAARLSDDSVVVLGGRAGAGPGATTETAERYDSSSGTWHALPELHEPRQRFAVVVADDRVTVLGGQTTGTVTNYVEWWGPGAEGWTLASVHLAMALTGHTATALGGGDIVVIGGEPPNAVDTGRAERWEEKAGRWCLVGELATSRKLHTATALGDGRVLVVGGSSGGLPERSAELWEPTKGPCEDPPGLSVDESL